MCGVNNFCANLWSYILTLLGWVFQVIVGFIWVVLCLVCVVTSPLWFPIYAIKSPESCAINLNASPDRKDGLLYFMRQCFVATFRFFRWFYAPLIAMLPMKIRAEFIRYGVKHVYDYPVKVQVAYFKSHDDGGKQSLIASSVFSPEAREAIWQDSSERTNWIESGITLTKEQVKDFCQSSGQSLAWRYFKGHTPDKEALNILIDDARRNYAGAQYVLLEFIKQQRPSAELVGKLLAIENTGFVEKVSEVIDAYADLDAVNFTITLPSDSEMSEEERQQIINERWMNFCKHKTNICIAAQKKMNHAQYGVFVLSGHKLDRIALRYLCLTVRSEEYLKEIIQNEFENIDINLQTALKAEYWRYSMYLAVKEERTARKQVA